MSFRPRSWVIGAVIGLFLAFFFSRTTDLLRLPIFTDEAIYVRWSQIGSRDANWRFISLTDGKQPMYTWVVMGVMKLVDDPLVAGRITSGISGSFTLLGIAVLSKLLFRSTAVALVATAIYVALPFTLLYDRLALYDSMVSTFSIWSMIGAVLLVRTMRFDVALLLGMTIGGAVLNKTSGFLNLYLLPTTVVLFHWSKSDTWRRLIIWLGLIVVVAIVSQIMYSVLRLSPFFHLVAEKNTIFVYPLADWLQHPTRFLQGNLMGLFDWLVGYMGYVLFLAALLSAVHRGFWREKLFLLAWWIVPFVGLATFGRVLYPRFILFMTLPLIVLSAWSIVYALQHIRIRFVQILMLFLCLLPSLVTSTMILADPVRVAIPRSDRNQLMDEWPSGYGVPETTQFFLQEITHRDIAVYTEGTFGLLPYAYEIYMVDHPRIRRIEGIWPVPTEMPIQMRQDAAEVTTYFVLNQSQSPPPAWKLELLSEFAKGASTTQKLRLYRVLP